MTDVAFCFARWKRYGPSERATQIGQPSMPPSDIRDFDGSLIRAEPSAGPGERPAMGSAQKPVFLRMNMPGLRPSAGSIPCDDFDLDGPWHYHDMHQLMCAFEGSIQVIVEGGRHLIPRTLAAWIPAGIPHRMNLHRVRSGSILFPVEGVERPGDRIRIVIVSPLMREMAKEAMRWPIGGPDSPLRSAFFETMGRFCSEWINEEGDFFLPVSDDPKLEAALQYTSENMDKKLPEICRHIGMSERSLRRHLKSAYGLSWEAYRKQIRLLRAIALLSETDLSIDEIAAQCGFESPSGFARTFRTAMNQAPRAYRAQIRNG